MKKLLIFIVIIGAAMLALMVTTPSRQQHADTIRQVMTGAVNAELRDYQIDGAFGSIASATATSSIDQFLNTSFLVRDHRFYSLGFIDYEGEFVLVSVGILGHVYTLDEDQARQLIRQKMSEINPLDYIELLK